MSSILPSNPSNATPRSFTDTSRPVIMQEADRVFEKLVLKKGGRPDEIVTFMAEVGAEILKTKSFELDGFWERMERKVLGPNQTLSTKATTSDAKLQVALGMFYTALNSIDQNAQGTRELAEFDTLFQEVAAYTLNRFAGQASSKDSRIYTRMVDVIDRRTTKVIERFNARVDAQEIPGPKL